MAQDNSQKLEQPVDTQVQPGLEARIFTMPESYRHGAQGVMHQPEIKTPPKPLVEVQPPTASSQSHLTKPSVAQKKHSGRKIIVLIGIIVLVLLSVGGYLLIQDAKNKTQPPVVTPAPTPRPAPETQPEPVKEPVVTEPEIEKPEVFPVEIVPGVDSDSDGLSDIEETLVYKTDPRLPDTDSDGFLDGNEVFHRYNPGGTAPGTLLGSGAVKVYKGTAIEILYEFYYPSTWSYQEVQNEIILDAQTGEGFHISVFSNPEESSFKDWIKQNFPTSTFVSGVTKNGLPMMQGEDQRTVYLDLTSVILSFVYDPGIKTRVDYLQIFQMMLNSVQVVGAVENSETTSETSIVQPE